MARKKRFIGIGESFYHIISRVVDKKFRFTPEENDRNVALLRRVETFSGVQVMTYCFMSNHLHILLRVPPREEITEEELINRVEILYGTKYVENMKKRWKECRTFGHESIVEREKAAFLKRMYDMGEFMKTLKQRLTMSFNGRMKREGTLWESRYKSILLQPTLSVLTAVAAYIERNPLRAGMVKDASLYAYSGYGEAVAGNEKARAGISGLYKREDATLTWETIVVRYRRRITYRIEVESGGAALTKSEVYEALKANHCRTIHQLLCERCRIFSTGIALGSPGFVKHITMHIWYREHGLPDFSAFLE